MLLAKIESMDDRLFLFLHRNLQCRLLDSLLPLLTRLGSAASTVSIASLMIAGGIILKRHDLFVLGSKMGLSLAIAHLVVHLTKRLVNRPRPSKKIEETRFFDVPICAYSFPSGHTSASFVLAVTALLWTSFGLPALAAASLVAFSRIYLGVHYVSDVAAGAAIGITVSAAISLI